MESAAPLILTVQLNNEAFHFFNDLRKQYFPPGRNYLDAHLTLFHNLPSTEEKIIQDIEALCLQQQTINLPVTEVVSIGRGVAYKIESAELIKLHKNLQQQWQQWLIPQDKQKLWPHITVQNKVSAPEAKNLQQQLANSFMPFTAYGTGLSLWEYLNGPWKFLKTVSFTGAVDK